MRVSRGPVGSRLVLGLAVVMLLAMPTVAEACPVCFGDIDGPAARGVNNGILAMLAVVGAVQFGLVAMFVSFWRRGKRLQERRESFKVINGGGR